MQSTSENQYNLEGQLSDMDDLCCRCACSAKKSAVRIFWRMLISHERSLVARGVTASLPDSSRPVTMPWSPSCSSEWSRLSEKLCYG